MSTINELATIAAKANNIDHSTAQDALTIYLQQVNQIDQANHSADSVPNDVAEFLLESVTHARRAGDI